MKVLLILLKGNQKRFSQNLKQPQDNKGTCGPGSVRSESTQFILLHPVPVQGRIEFMSQFVRPLRRF